MKTNKLRFIAAMMLFMGAFVAHAQQPDMQYFRPESKEGLNVFESPKENDVEFTGLKVRVGGDFALQFQGISQSNDADTLVDLANNFTLPTANLNLDVQLADGLRMHLRTYLSSRHHTEAYVKGGYIQMDKLDFVKPGFLEKIMNVTTIRVGMDEINYGDAHFRRTDNARAIFNPFVGNYIMDGFTTEPFAEVTVQKSGFIGVLGATNGRLNQSPEKGDDGYVLYGKLGYDQQLNDDLRVRLTGSFYSSSDKSTRDYLYAGDRAGARYYDVMKAASASSDPFTAARLNPGFGYLTSFQVNPFVKFKGVEFFGVYEVTNNGNDEVGGSFTQLGTELLYRFGTTEQFYIGGRYNEVNGENSDVSETKNIKRINVGGGWFLTKNVMAKVEYVKQTYNDAGFDNTLYQGGQFDGIMIEAAIGF